MASLDPDGSHLHVAETDTDVLIQLISHKGTIFDKGQGIQLFTQHMQLDLSDPLANILICGDSNTDIPMLRCVCFCRAGFAAKRIRYS